MYDRVAWCFENMADQFDFYFACVDSVTNTSIEIQDLGHKIYPLVEFTTIGNAKCPNFELLSLDDIPFCLETFEWLGLAFLNSDRLLSS